MFRFRLTVIMTVSLTTADGAPVSKAVTNNWKIKKDCPINLSIVVRKPALGSRGIVLPM